MGAREERSDGLARAALDALPIRLAIVDRNGVIVDTNRGWREFAAESGSGDPAMIGVDYLAASREAAPEVAEGIEGVLAAETDVYTHEYPCETPTEQRWYLLRAAPFVRDGSRYATIAHIDITERKRKETQLDALVSRLSGVLTDAGSVIASAESEAAVFEGLPKTLVSAPPYLSAWTMSADMQSDALELEYVAGRLHPPDVQAVPLDDSGAGLPEVQAFDTLEPVIRSRGEELGSLADPGGPASRTTVAILCPIHHSNTRYGLLGVEVHVDSVSPDVEASALAATARIAGQALHSIEQHRVIHGSVTVDLEYAGSLQDDPVVDVARTVDATASLETVVAEGAEESVLLEVSGADPAAFCEEARSREAVRSVGITGEPDAGVVRIEAVDSLFECLFDHPASLRQFDIGEHRTTVGLQLPSEERARELHVELTEAFPGLDLVEKRTRQGSENGRGSLEESVVASLTERQETALKLAYHGGFFESPRGTDGDELAASMDITRQTFHQHLRSAQRKVFEDILESASIVHEAPTAD